MELKTVNETRWLDSNSISCLCSFKCLVNFVGICSVIDYIVVWLRLMMEKINKFWEKRKNWNQLGLLKVYTG